MVGWRAAGTESGSKRSRPDKIALIFVLVLNKWATKAPIWHGLLTRRTHIGEPDMALSYYVRLCRRLPFEGADEHERRICETRL